MAEAAEPETAPVGRMPDVSVFHSEDFDPIDFCNRLFPTDSSLERLPDAMNAIQKQADATYAQRSKGRRKTWVEQEEPTTIARDWGWGTQIDDIDARILQTVRDQSSSSGRARADLAFVQEAVKQLFGKMEGIQEKAQETEGLVNTICKDITRLDQAKSNLTISISGLRRLAMLIDAVDQLKAQVGRSGVKRMDFKQVAAMLGAAGTLVEEFQDHANIPQVMELCSDFKALRKQVETMVLAEFKGSWMTHDISEDEKKDIPDYEQWMEDIHGEKFRKMEECCGIVAVLGTDMRAAVMNDITTKELELYSAMKPLLTGISKHKKPLDENMQSRYQWFLDRMTAPLFRRQWAVFPRSWRMRQDMSMRFCKVVRAQLGELLDQAANDATLDVATLIKTVSLTQRFEQLLERLMAASVHHRWTSGGHSLLDDEGPSEEQRRVMAAEERLRTYAKANRPATAAADGSGPFPDDEDDGEPMQFVGVVSSAFQGHLNLYLRQAESELYDTLGKLILDEHGCGWTSPDPLSHILSSANLLLTAIRDAATRCKKGLGSGKALQELSVVFDKVLGSYAQELTKQLCKPSSGVIPSGTALLALKDSDWQVTASNETLVIACHIVHTGVFCDSKCQDLQRWLQQLTQPPWSQDINLAQSQKAFQAVINSAVQVLALAVATRLEGALSELKAFKWDIGDAPEDGQDHLQGSGFSPFVQQAQTVLRESAAVLKAHLHSMRGTDGGEQDGGGSDDGGDEDDGIDDYYWVVCGRAVTMFGPRLEDAVLKCRRISSAGSQQLYQDVQTVQTELAAFPRLSNWASDPGYAEFTQTLRSMLYPAVNLAKVIQMSSTAELMLETWKSLMPLEKQNVADLKALLDLLHDTHMTKSAKNDLLTQYSRMLEGLPAPSISRPPPPRPSPAGTTASTTAAEPTALAMASSSTAGPDAASGRFSSSRFMPRMGLPGSWSSRSTPGLSHLKSAAASVGHGGSVAGEKVASLGAKMTRGTRDGLSSLGSGLSSTSRALGARMASSIPFRGGGGTGSGPAGSAGG